MIGAARLLSELDVVALTLHHEAGAESVVGMTAVGCVLKNRAAWGKWGPTMRDVCLAHKQFSCWRPAGGTTNYTRLLANADSLRADRRPPSMARAFQVAYSLYSDLDDVSNGADHYYAPAAMTPRGRVPAWAQGVTPCAHIGGHIFFRLRPQADRETTDGHGPES